MYIESDEEREYMRRKISNWDDLSIEAKEELLEQEYKTKLSSKYAKQMGEK